MTEQIQHLQKNGFKLSQMAILVNNHFRQTVFTYFKDRNLAITLQRLSSLADSKVVQSLIEINLLELFSSVESALKTALGGQSIGISNIEILQA